MRNGLSYTVTKIQNLMSYSDTDSQKKQQGFGLKI